MRCGSESMSLICAVNLSQRAVAASIVSMKSSSTMWCTGCSNRNPDSQRRCILVQAGRLQWQPWHNIKPERRCLACPKLLTAARPATAAGVSEICPCVQTSLGPSAKTAATIVFCKGLNRYQSFDDLRLVSYEGGSAPEHLVQPSKQPTVRQVAQSQANMWSSTPR